ncbi:MAG: hypothetical protein GOV02_02635 [Candidatus Aenigmarchaeota archaeon]|nr:hypothetical protein [Candidatus Aenigmarchaeota archaeon]
MSGGMTEDQVREHAARTNQAFSGASEYGQMIMNPRQMKNVYEKYYGGHKQTKGTFSDDWKNWTTPWITNQNPDGEYIQGVLNNRGNPASFYDIMASPFSDAMSVVSTFDFFSSIREGWFLGSNNSKKEAQMYVNSIRQQAAQEYEHEQASISAIRKGRVRREVRERLGDFGEVLDLAESMPDGYSAAAIIDALGSRTGRRRRGP